MNDDNALTLLVPLAIAAVAMWGCYALAQSKGYSVGWALGFGFFFGIFALIVYALLPRKGPERRASQPSFNARTSSPQPPPIPPPPPPPPPPPSAFPDH